jgi:hypothetical protein
MALPRHFCWTRFGTEAGEGVDQILRRKEDERLANDGVFLWGIGNAIGPSMCELVRRESSPQVIFSPIRSAPRPEDCKPESTVAWTLARTLSGEIYNLPAGSVVTSRAAGEGRLLRHYALVCASVTPLGVNRAPHMIQFSRLRNLVTGRPVGASQVTAVVRMSDECEDDAGKEYPAAIRASLVFPYFIELIEPMILPASLVSEGRGGTTLRTAVLCHVQQSRLGSESAEKSATKPFGTWRPPKQQELALTEG